MDSDLKTNVESRLEAMLQTYFLGSDYALTD